MQTNKIKLTKLTIQTNLLFPDYTRPESIQPNQPNQPTDLAI